MKAPVSKVKEPNKEKIEQTTAAKKKRPSGTRVSFKGIIFWVLLLLIGVALLLTAVLLFLRRRPNKWWP